VGPIRDGWKRSPQMLTNQPARHVEADVNGVSYAAAEPGVDFQSHDSLRPVDELQCDRPLPAAGVKDRLCQRDNPGMVVGLGNLNFSRTNFKPLARENAHGAARAVHIGIHSIFLAWDKRLKHVIFLSSTREKNTQFIFI